MTEPILTVDGLTVAFGKGRRELTALRDVSFSLARGQTLALVGESGSGKSVSALSILQLLPYPQASHPGGEIMFEGRNLIGADEKAMRAISSFCIACRTDE